MIAMDMRTSNNTNTIFEDNNQSSPRHESLDYYFRYDGKENMIAIQVNSYNVQKETWQRDFVKELLK